MKTVDTWQDIENNINQLEEYRSSANPQEAEDYKKLIKRGICFVVTKRNGELVFSPSRFIGYKDNSMDVHEANTTKDGRVTNPVISRIIGKELEQDEYLEEQYKKFCIKLGIQPGKGGQFGIRRKYWTK